MLAARPVRCLLALCRRSASCVLLQQRTSLPGDPITSVWAVLAHPAMRLCWCPLESAAVGALYPSSAGPLSCTLTPMRVCGANVRLRLGLSSA